MTFFVEGYADLDRKNIPADLRKKLVAHGSRQMNTEGRITVAFYYTEEGAAPNISNLSSSAANDVAHDHDPLLAVWQHGNGNVVVIEDPNEWFLKNPDWRS